MSKKYLGHYKLVGHATVPCSIEEWAKWFEEASKNNADGRRVAEDIFYKTQVSTVFLGIGHGWGGKILLFETMIFSDNKKINNYQERYRTWEEAERGHARITWMAKRAENTIIRRIRRWLLNL